ncbi:PREDICTED: nascent polypeptide-associated complex subunit alpha, muscle-specific form-like [Camelina sativa]|uniref:Nascent polypeptide-associated complex subunit alpha, muscle-specific form-like n=1 Tax=Camelina sativa TaxID=90675 RepID=A0ABM0WFB6_CAMSA|nr:PREDICTED: nascent polypeptide-associated complex subunit alpha, muscle-specific form-like [Camelina sativa]
MVDKSTNNKKRKEFISEEDIATLLQRYDTATILKLLQEMAYYADTKMDWNELVKKTSTGITNAREYQLLWRHLAYRDSLLPVEDNAQLLNDDSDMECELEASPAVSVDVVTEAVAHVKVMAASYVPSESDIPEDSTVEAPMTINIPYGLYRGAQEPSDSYWSSRGMNITFPVSLPKAAEGHNGNGLPSSMAPRKRRKKWSAEEDEELIAAVKRHGEGSWALIAKEEFEGERTPSQLSQRWGAIKRRCDTSNTSTQTGLQRTEAQMAANRALSLAVGNRIPAKKLAVGTPPLPSSGTITGAQANGANSGSTLQSQQKSQPQVQALPRAPAPTAKSRVPAKKTTTNSTSRAALVTANSVAAAACMSVPKTEPGKNAVSVLVPKVEPVKTPSTASLSRPSGISSALNAEPVKAASAASVPRPLGIISVPKAETVKTAASAASLLRPSGIIPAPKAEPVKTATSAAPRPSGIQSAPKAEPVKPAASAASGPRPGMILAPKAEPLKPVSAASLPRPPGIISAPMAEPVKSAPAASVPRPSNILSAPKADPVKSVSATVSNTKAFGPSNLRHAVNGSPNHTISLSPSNKPSLMAPLSKGSTIQNNSVPPSFASSRLVSTQRVPAATLMPQKPSEAALNAFSKPVGVQKEQTQGNRASPLVTTTLPAIKTSPTNSVISTSKVVATKVETPPSLMPKKNQVVDSCTDKSSLDKPPEEESSSTAASPLVVATAESKSKDEASNRESQDVAAVTGTRQEEL